MAAHTRSAHEPAPSTESQMTYTRFMELFPSHDVCLDYLKERFYPDDTECPKCAKRTRFHRIKSRSAYSCQFCGHQVYPTADTIFHKSTVSLQLWFWAIYLLSSTRCGISAKQLEREIGVTYKTAHRMFKMIRTLLSDDDQEPLSGDVEMDETLIGGKPRVGQVRNRREGRMFTEQKAKVFGMVERGGRVHAYHVLDRTAKTLAPLAKIRVLPDAMIYTDEYPPYVGIGKKYRGHRRIKHKARVYVEGETHTQTIDGFFGLLKTGIRGVYHSVSTEYLQSYLNEYTFRYNRRDGREPIFWAILDRVRKDAA